MFYSSITHPPSVQPNPATKQKDIAPRSSELFNLTYLFKL